MKTIILNHYYPHLTERVMLEVSDEIAVTLSIGGRLCDSYKRRKPLTRLWQAGREDSAGDNETCSRPPTDLRGSPCGMRQSVQRGYAAEAIGGLEYSPRRGCVANTAQYKRNQGGRPSRGVLSYDSPNYSGGAAPGLCRLKWNTVAGFLITLLLITKIPVGENKLLFTVINSPVLLMLLAVIFVIAMYVVSILVSIKILKNKEM